MAMNVLLLTDDAQPDSVLPTLGLVARTVRHEPLARPAGRTTLVADATVIDAAIVDARSDVSRARRACRKVAARSPQAAVVVVVSPEDLVTVDLSWRIDDVVVPTACPAELQTRLRLAVARRRRAMGGTVTFGDLVLHPASYVASLPDRKLELTLTEFKLLTFLVQNAGRAFTRTRLMHEVWGHECRRRTVDVHVQRLRAKLGTEYESMVDTVRGVGYMAVSPPPPSGAVAAPPPAKIAVGQ